LRATVEDVEEAGEIVLIGLTLDCCVLCTAQELCFRGYRVRFLTEAVDTYSGSQEEKLAILKTPLANWGRPISWEQFRTATAS
jgi:nicotinamidase-related amidase